jgi:hypothetical protein
MHESHSASWLVTTCDVPTTGATLLRGSARINTPDARLSGIGTPLTPPTRILVA